MAEDSIMITKQLDELNQKRKDLIDSIKMVELDKIKTIELEKNEIKFKASEIEEWQYNMNKKDLEKRFGPKGKYEHVFKFTEDDKKIIKDIDDQIENVMK